MKQNLARRFASICFLSACISFSIKSQESPASPQAPTIRVQSSLVLVDVITKDPKTGLPLRNLQKSDFRVYDNHREVEISTFDAGAHFGTRPVIVWLAVICNEKGKIGGSANYVGKEVLFRPALDQLDKTDTVGVAHWCDDGETKLDLLPTKDHDSPIGVLAETIKPITFAVGGASNLVGERTFRKMVRLIIQDAQRRNPQPLPVVVFIDGDHTGQPIRELNELVDDFLETSGIVFGIKDYLYPAVHLSNGEQGQILHYMAEQTGGQYFTVQPSEYAAALEMILMQLHFRYQLGFIPPAIDGKRHKLKVEFTKEAKEKYKGVRLNFRQEYIPVLEPPEWAR